MDHDAVVMQRRADLKYWVDGYEDVDRHLETQLGIDTPENPAKAKRRSTRPPKT